MNGAPLEVVRWGETVSIAQVEDCEGDWLKNPGQQSGREARNQDACLRKGKRNKNRFSKREEVCVFIDCIV